MGGGAGCRPPAENLEGLDQEAREAFAAFKEAVHALKELAEQGEQVEGAFRALHEACVIRPSQRPSGQGGKCVPPKGNGQRPPPPPPLDTSKLSASELAALQGKLTGEACAEVVEAITGY